MSMPLHQISAIPSQDATSVRVYRNKSKEKEREEQNEKTLGHSMNHSSTISKILVEGRRFSGVLCGLDSSFPSSLVLPHGLPYASIPVALWKS